MAAKGASMRRLVHIRARAAILDHLNCDRILRCYEHAAGSELLSGKFASPESSAALAANTFVFFLDRPELLSLPAPPVAAGTAQSVCFETEMRFPWRGGKHPWLDGNACARAKPPILSALTPAPQRTAGTPIAVLTGRTIVPTASIQTH